MTGVLVITLGATALLTYDAQTGSMVLGLQPSELLARAAVDGVDTVLQSLPARSGAELTLHTVFQIRDAVLANLADVPGVVVLIGTDTMEEAALLLHLTLGNALLRHGKALCLCGAMLPADILGTDGPRNLQDAIKVACDPAAPSCALCVMNDGIHLAQYVAKADSQTLNAFRSHPGPIGQMRGGAPYWYYAPPPPTSPSWLPDEAFERLPATALRERVAIWTLGVSGFLPDALLEHGQLDGLVLAGSGTGSLPASVVDQLATAWTSRLAVVISSRCGTGGNHDDHLYRGSRAKYEGRGFVLGGGYEQLNPLQARVLLILRLSAFGHA